MRDALKLADEATITARMNAIPHSNYRAVVFTKEQYARIPLRDDTVDEHAQDMLYDFVAAGYCRSIQIPVPKKQRSIRTLRIWASIV